MVLDAAHELDYRRFKDPADLERPPHALAFLRNAHRSPDTGGDAWVLEWGRGPKRLADATNRCYGPAFVVLAYSHALMAGPSVARDWLDETCALMEQRFWEPQHGLYADEATAGWQVGSYRGRNANMHACKAMLATHDATGEARYLHRTETLAHNITVRQGALYGDLIRGHDNSDWSVAPDYNRDDKTDIFRPWDHQPDHLTEWAKFLLILERYARHPQGRSDWLLPRAHELFDAALSKAWDHQHGGIHYGFGPAESISSTTSTARGTASSARPPEGAGRAHQL
jgi:mannose/cellobiose epimerase-like protein (N-acyl-D-glucosamine 2-epimerase family)